MDLRAQATIFSAFGLAAILFQVGSDYKGLVLTSPPFLLLCAGVFVAPPGRVRWCVARSVQAWSTLVFGWIILWRFAAASAVNDAAGVTILYLCSMIAALLAAALFIVAGISRVLHHVRPKVH